jgi:hypothetical protein
MQGGAQGEINTLNSMLSILRDRITKTHAPLPLGLSPILRFVSNLGKLSIGQRRGERVGTMPARLSSGQATNLTVCLQRSCLVRGYHSSADAGWYYSRGLPEGNFPALGTICALIGSSLYGAQVRSLRGGVSLQCSFKPFTDRWQISSRSQNSYSQLADCPTQRTLRQSPMSWPLAIQVSSTM